MFSKCFFGWMQEHKDRDKWKGTNTRGSSWMASLYCRSLRRGPKGIGRIQIAEGWLEGPGQCQERRRETSEGATFAPLQAVAHLRKVKAMCAVWMIRDLAAARGKDLYQTFPGRREDWNVVLKKKVL